MVHTITIPHQMCIYFYQSQLNVEKMEKSNTRRNTQSVERHRPKKRYNSARNMNKLKKTQKQQYTSDQAHKAKENKICKRLIDNECFGRNGELYLVSSR